MSAPARACLAAVRPLRSPAAPRLGAAQECGSLLWQMAPALGELAARYPDASDQVIRQQAIEVLCLAQGNRVDAVLVARLVEARILALL